MTENRYLNRSITFEVEEDKDAGDDTEKIEDLDERWKELAKFYFNETDQTKQELIDELRAKVRSDTPSYRTPDTDTFFLKLLRAGGGTVAGAMDVLRNWFTLKHDHPHYLEKSMPDLIQMAAKEMVSTFLPHRDKYGRRVFIWQLGKFNPDKVELKDLFCLNNMMCELLARETKTQISGITSIVDAGGFGWKQLRAFTYDDARTLAKFIQDSFPIWFRQIHIVNGPRFFWIAYQALKPMLNDHVRSAFVFHGNDLTTLHQDVDPEILPEEFGGKMGKIDWKYTFEMVKKREEYYREIMDYGINEE